MQALKGIFGWRLSYADLLALSNTDRLDYHREICFTKLAEKMSESSRFTSWFPLRLYRGDYEIRSREKYKLYRAASERYLVSPLNMMRRKLNEMNMLESF